MTRPVDVLLVKARCGIEMARETARPPLGVQYLAGWLRARNPGPLSLRFADLRLPGTSVEEVAAEAAGGVDLVGISALSVEAASAALLARLLKEKRPSLPVVVGGPLVTSGGPGILDDVPADVAVLGEGEEPFEQLVRVLAGTSWRPDAWRLIGDIPSIAARDGSGVHVSRRGPPRADLDTLPFPDRTLVDESRYEGIEPGSRDVYTPVLTSRGCPYACTYCHKIDGRKFRARSAPNVLAELEELALTGRRRIAIVDDVFNLDEERASAICRGIVDRRLGLDLRFGNGMRVDILSDELVELLARAGTRRVCVAVESGSERMMRKIGKRLDATRVLRAIKHLRKHGVVTQGMFMIGFPTETLEEIEETVDFARRSDLDMATFFKVVPLPGTELYEEAVRIDPSWPEKVGSGRYWYHSEPSFFQDVTGIDLHSIWKAAFWRFYDPARARRLGELEPAERDRWSHIAERSARIRGTGPEGVP